MDVIFARATGRGRSKEADVSWGETIANRVVCEKNTVIEEPADKSPVDRLRAPYILGIPLFVSKSLTGALVLSDSVDLLLSPAVWILRNSWRIKLLA